ncbi:MAG: Endothelin-converting enzyme 1, partial [Myxococcales bacterium]|nr:Endothelin-converting enzyme 1 [Myxococcales bacterium]
MRLLAPIIFFAAAACSSKAPKSAMPAPASPTTTATTATSGTPATVSSAPVSMPAAQTSAAPANTQATKVSLADVGLEAASLDRSVDPCVDFYVFACGGWLATNQIPEDRARWTRFTEIEEHNKASLKKLLDEDTKSSADPAARKLGDFYASCMDELAIERAGTKSIAPLLDTAQKAKDAKTWFKAIAE